MDVLSWLWWLFATLLWGAFGLVWFLISGWVSTLLQVAILVFAVYYMKYGWKRAPAEIWRRTSAAARFFWNWVRAREPQAGEVRVEEREVLRTVRVKDFGDINLSTLMSLVVLVGLYVMWAG